ncbi:MAG: DUF4214 domain-containing protein [Pseudomonadota bacterium]
MTEITAFAPLNTYDLFGERFPWLNVERFEPDAVYLEGDGVMLKVTGDLVGSLSGRVTGLVDSFEFSTFGTPTLSVEIDPVQADTLLPLLSRGNFLPFLDEVLSGDDRITGSRFTDVVEAGTGDDRVHLGKGADFFYTGFNWRNSGNDTVQGGDDDAIDTVVFGPVDIGRRSFDAVEIREILGGVEVTDLVDGTVDRLFGFERYVFGDRAYELDEILIPSGQEAWAAEEVGRVMATVLDYRATWSTYRDRLNEDIDRRAAGTDLLEITEDLMADFFDVSLRWIEPWEDFVGRLYINAFNRGADEAGLAHWSEQLSSGAMTRAELLVGFTFSEEGILNNRSIDTLVESGPSDWAFA